MKQPNEHKTPNLDQHLATGVTTLCRCWSLRCLNGRVMGFTDHDRDVMFEQTRFQADTGLSSAAVQQSTGLSVDNSEIIGALNALAITEADIRAGVYDYAEIRMWIVNWHNTAQRCLHFYGRIGEITYENTAFRAEIRAQSSLLNIPLGRVYQRNCTATLGDSACRFDLSQQGYQTPAIPIETINAQHLFTFSSLAGYSDRWFEKGTITVLSGKAQGTVGLIKKDTKSNQSRSIELWHPLSPYVQSGDKVQLAAGCDKTPAMCYKKFNNMANFQGFPHIPGEDWLISYPSASGVNDGGKL